MGVPIFQVDAFTTRRFAGNPAAVLILDGFPGDDVLQAVAAENNLAETAFLVPGGVDYRLRWFTPTVEVPLCGHATLASAAVVLERLRPDLERVVFDTASGPLTVDRAGPAYRMDLPARTIRPVATPPGLAATLGADAGEVVEVVDDGHNYLVRLADAATVRSLAPDLAAIARLDRGGVIVTATGDAGYDVVSRYFAPAKGIPEDPVTGGAHCGLTPYWAERLGTTRLRAFQASRRGGELDCRLAGDRVHLTGSCVFYLEGEATLPDPG